MKRKPRRGEDSPASVEDVVDDTPADVERPMGGSRPRREGIE